MTEKSTTPHLVQGLPIRTIRVEVTAGPDAGKSHDAGSESVTIGTGLGNDLQLTDSTVSRYHLELVRSGDRILASDNGSTNGTFSGDLLIERARIPSSSSLRLGKTTIRVDDGGVVNLELHQQSDLAGFRGESPRMRELMSRLEKLAKSDVSVLLHGETGSGKEVAARALHDRGSRKDKPFVVVDCGTLMPTLIASEMFGHERGAFTGAEKRHIGAFERANGGTLFLDEIGELPTDLQASLLGALERRRFRRVGGTEEIATDVRVVSATHRDLRTLVNEGGFREDLYYRLAVVRCSIPALRERTDDLEILIEHFLKQLGIEDMEELFPEEVVRVLERHDWPGNVRELRNFVEATVALGQTPDLGEERVRNAPLAVVDPSVADQTYRDARGAVLLEFEKVYFKGLMERAGGNAAQAARDAKMDRSYLFQFLKKHSIPRSAD